MSTELQNLKQQVDSLQENTELITQDIVRIMPKVVSVVSENEKNLKDLYEMRIKDQELLGQIQTFIKRENSILTKIIEDYGSLQDVTAYVVESTREEIKKLVNKEKEIVSKIATIPNQINVKHQYGIDLKSTPVIAILLLFLIAISLGIGVLYEKSKNLDEMKSYEMRYRRMELDLPNVTARIDSIYSSDPHKFRDLTIKREEENKLLQNVEKKRREISDLNND